MLWSNLYPHNNAIGFTSTNLLYSDLSATEQLGPGARFSKVLKSFQTRKAIPKISTLMFTELSFSHNFQMKKVSLHANFHEYVHYLVFQIWLIKDGFSAPLPHFFGAQFSIEQRPYHFLCFRMTSQ